MLPEGIKAELIYREKVLAVTAELLIIHAVTSHYLPVNFKSEVVRCVVFYLLAVAHVEGDHRSQTS